MSKALKKLIDINRLREFKNKLVGAGSAYVQTAAVDQTIAGTKTFSKPIVGSVTGSSGSCTGNAATATKATQDAAGNTITTTYATKAENNTKANNSEVVHKSGDETIAGTKTFSNGVLLTNANALMAQRDGYTLVLRNDGDDTYLLMSDKDGVPGTWSDARPLRINNPTGVCNINGNATTATTAATAQACTGNAATATKATQDSDGNQINTTYSKNGHTHDDRYYTETEVDHLLNGKANTYGTYNNFNAGNGVDSRGDDWIRFRNGIQICWAKILCDSSGSSRWTYGANFLSKPVITVCDSGSNTNAVYLTRAGDVGTTSCVIVMVNASGGSYMSGQAQCIAIGNWKTRPL